MVKFSAQIDREVLEQLREHAAETGRTLAWVLTQAASEYLERARLRPAFVSAAEEIINDHAELLERLAK